MEILIVEDDQTTAKQLVKLLKSEKYGCDLASGYKQAEALLDRNNYALILLDWNLGDGDGLKLLKELRKMGMRTPVMMLSANSQIDEKVVVLDAGADDYLCKPYSSIELLARIRALLRRESKEKSSSIEIEDVKLDTTTRQVFVGALAIELTASEFDILELFMQNPNRVLTRFQLSEHINKDNYSVKYSNIIDVHIKNIRKKLGRKEFIKSVRGVGYRVDK